MEEPEEKPEVINDKLQPSKVKRYCTYRKTWGDNKGELCEKTALYNGTAYLLPHERLTDTYQAYFCKKHFEWCKRTMNKRAEDFRTVNRIYDKGIKELEKRGRIPPSTTVSVPLAVKQQAPMKVLAETVNATLGMNAMLDNVDERHDQGDHRDCPETCPYVVVGDASSCKVFDEVDEAALYFILNQHEADDLED